MSTEEIKISTLEPYTQHVIYGMPRKFNPDGNDTLNQEEIGELLTHYKKKGYSINSIDDLKIDRFGDKVYNAMFPWLVRDGGDTNEKGEFEIIYSNGKKEWIDDEACRQRAADYEKKERRSLVALLGTGAATLVSLLCVSTPVGFALAGTLAVATAVLGVVHKKAKNDLENMNSVRYNFPCSSDPNQDFLYPADDVHGQWLD